MKVSNESNVLWKFLNEGFPLKKRDMTVLNSCMSCNARRSRDRRRSSRDRWALSDSFTAAHQSCVCGTNWHLNLSCIKPGESLVLGNPGRLLLQSLSPAPGVGQGKVVPRILRFATTNIYSQINIWIPGQGGGGPGVARERAWGRYCNITVELMKILQGYCKT